MYTHDYDSSYAYGPALPIVELFVRSVAATDGGTSLRALVDSGADATILPLAVLQNAHVDQVGRARMRWGSHQSQMYDVYLVTIAIGPYEIYGVRVLADPTGSEAILGRDVLNQMVVTLNGLAHIVEVSQ
jgi:predicted aspartyl protease